MIAFPIKEAMMDALWDVISPEKQAVGQSGRQLP